MPAANTDPCFLPVHRLAAEIAARRLSPVEVVEAFLARIAAHEPKLHAYVDVYADDARLAADAADKAIRSGHTVGPLHGVPIALSLDTPGPMARSGEDGALLYSVMQGADPLDPRPLSAPPPMDPIAGMRRGVRGMRLARMPGAEREDCTPEMLAAYDMALD